MTAASLLVALLALLPGAGLPLRLPEDTFKVASEGGRWCCILASEKHAKLARELNIKLSMATSATFPIHQQPHANTAYIVLGTADEHPDVAKQERLAELGPEGFAVRSEERRLWLVANTPLGLQHAVYRLLHHIGFRCYFPDSSWHVTPIKPDLTVTLRIREKPAFGYRRIWYGWGPQTPVLKQDYDAWLRCNRQLGHFRVDCGHAWERHIPRGEFAKHPEWFALVKGKRKPTQLCVTNPELQREFVRRVVEACRKHGESKMISVEPNDGGGYCECDGCKKLGRASDGVFHLASLTARAVRKEFPDRWVGLYAYAGHSEPPTAPIASGVYVQVTTGFRYTKLTFDEQVAAFRKRGAKLGVYDYFSVYPWDRDMPGAAKGGRVYELADALRHYHKLELSTYDAESSCNWGPNGLGYWVAAQMMWDPALDPKALVEDFCRHAFGKAAKPMRQLYERWATGERFSARGLKLALLDVQEARTLEADPAVRRRLCRVAMYLHHLRLWHDHDQASRWDESGKLASPPEEILAKARACVVYARRIMDTGLIHTHPMLFTSWFPRRFAALGKIKDFDWKQAEPWKTERTDVPKPDEVERDFADDLAHFADYAAMEIRHTAFAGPLVPLAEKLPAAVEAWGGVGRSPLIVETGVHHFIGTKGEAIALPYTPHGRGHTVDCPWTLRRDGDDKPIASGHVKAAKGQPATVQLTLPADGLYAFDPGTAYWKAAQIGFGPRPLSVWCGRADTPGRPKRMPFRLWLPRTSQPLYFFVPKGTEHFVVGITSGGNPFTHVVLRAADGSVVREAKRVRAGDQLSIVVPKGKDGAVWSLALGSLRCVTELYDVPPYVARHPRELLVPANALTPVAPAPLPQ